MLIRIVLLIASSFTLTVNKSEITPAFIIASDIELGNPHDLKLSPTIECLS